MNILTCAKKRGKDYEKGYADGVTAGIKIAIKVNMLQFIQFLGDKRGWRRESIFAAMQWTHKHAEMILEDYTTLKEVEEAVKEEYGIIYKDGTFYLLEEGDKNE